MDFKAHSASPRSYICDNRLLVKGPEVQQYMKKKRQEWKKKQKDEVALSHAAMRAKKEKLEALEMERRARLCCEGINGREKSETAGRPQWDSNTLSPASDINGPWSNISELTMEIDFPLPKPVDTDEFPVLCLEANGKSEKVIDYNTKSRLKSPQVRAEICSERNSFPSKGRSRGRKISGNKYICNGASYKNTMSLQSSENRKLKKRHTTSEFIKNDVGKKKAQCHSQKSFKENTKKPIISMNYSKQQKELLASGRLSAHRIAHITSNYMERHPKECLPNKRKIATFNPADETLNACERRHKMPTRKKMCSSQVKFLDPLKQGMHLVASSNLCNKKDAELRQKPDHAQCITYHQEKLPYKYQVEVLNERKRVALLKLLAQQLVKRIDAAQLCSSSPPHTGKVQAHALLLRRNLVKFQKKIYSIEKSLQGDCHQSSRKKTSGFIVLPCKLQRNSRPLSITTNQGEESQEYCKLLETRNAVNQNVVSCSSSSDLSFHASISSIISLSNGIISSERSVSSCLFGGPGKDQYRYQYSIDSLYNSEGDKDQRLEKLWHNSNQDSRENLQTPQMDIKKHTTGRGFQIWDHQLLVKELEKLDGEIRDTKARMANKLQLVSSSADKEFAMRSISSSMECNNHVQYLPKKEQKQMLNLIDDTDPLQNKAVLFREDHLNFQSHDPAFNEILESSVRNNIHRKQGESVEIRKSKDNVLSVFENSAAENEENANLYEHKHITITSNVCTNDLQSNQGKNYNTALITTLDCRLDSMTADFITENAPCHLNAAVKEPENTRFCVNPEVKNNMLNNELPTDKLTTEIVPERHREKDSQLAESITEFLMEELIEDEISDVLLHCRSLSHLGTRIGEDMSKLSMGNVDNIVRKSHIESSNNNLINLHGQSKVTTVKVESGVEHVLRSDDMETEPFRVTSKRMVEKFVDIAFQTCGLSSSNLADVYASEKTMGMIVVELMSKESYEAEDMLYGKLLLGAVSECLYKCYSSLYLPSFFLFLRPCPDTSHLKQILISKVNEQADAACEGGFSLEHMLERSLDEQDWQNPYCEIMEIAEDICEFILQDMLENFVDDIAHPIVNRDWS